jgi:hypothetical protein
MFPVCGGKCLSRKAFHNWVANVSLMTKIWNWGAEMAETTVKRFLCCGFRRNGKAMGQVYQCWWRISPEIFFSQFCSIAHTAYYRKFFLLHYIQVLYKYRLCKADPPCLYPLGTDHVENTSILLLRACMMRAFPSNGRCLHSLRLATGICLPSRCPETCMVYTPIPRSLQSNGYTRYSILQDKFNLAVGQKYCQT